MLTTLNWGSILRWLWVPQIIVSGLVHLWNTTIYIFVSNISRSMLPTWRTNISWLLNMISTAKWISVGLWLFSRWPNWGDAVTLGYIFTIFWISGICDGIQLWLLLNKIRWHLLLLTNDLNIRCLSLIMSLKWIITAVSLGLKHLTLISSWSNLTISARNSTWLDFVRD